MKKTVDEQQLLFDARSIIAFVVLAKRYVPDNACENRKMSRSHYSGSVGNYFVCVYSDFVNVGLIFSTNDDFHRFSLHDPDLYDKIIDALMKLLK